MKLSRFRPAIFALISSAGLLHADVVTLKDGKKLEGNILSEGTEGIRMRYRLTPKIWDEKNILKTDIAEIVKQKPEEVELIDLRKELPTPDLMSAEKYEQLIQDRLRPFVNRYPGTKEAEEAGKMITLVQEEKERVVAGGAKLEGKWLTPDEAKVETYNIKAYGLRSSMNEKAKTNDFNAALKEFDKLSHPQTGYIASIYYPKAVEEALAFLTKYEAQIEQMIKDQPTLQRLREESVKKLIEPDLTRQKDAIVRESEQWKTTAELERKSNPKWITPYKYDIASLKDLSKNIIAEKARLKEIDVPTLSKVNEAVGRVMRADAGAGKSADELKKMGEAILEGETAAGGLDTNNKQVFAAIFQAYRARYAYAQQQLAALTAQQAMPAAVPGATGGSTAIAGAGTPGTDERVAAALAAAGGATAAPAAAAPGAMPAGTAPTAIAPSAVLQAVPQQQQPAYAQPNPNAEPMPVEEEGGMGTNTLLMIGMGVVIIVLLVAVLMKKK